MKIRKYFIALAVFVIFLVSHVNAQNPPHPNGGTGPGSGNTPVGGGAPIGGSLFILLSLGLGYTAKKAYDIRSRSLEE